MSLPKTFGKRCKLTALGKCKTTHDIKDALHVDRGVPSTYLFDASRSKLRTLTHKAREHTVRTLKTNMLERSWIDTETGMLSGISQKRSIRSNPYWFTEFCNSQCLSHFAAPFIVVRAETSVAESCVTNVFSHYRISEQWCQVTRQQESNGRTVPFHINCCPRVSRQGYWCNLLPLQRTSQ